MLNELHHLGQPKNVYSLFGNTGCWITYFCNFYRDEGLMKKNQTYYRGYLDTQNDSDFHVEKEVE